MIKAIYFRHSNATVYDQSELLAMDPPLAVSEYSGPFWIRGSAWVDLTGAQRVYFEGKGDSLPLSLRDGKLFIPFADGSYYVCGVNKKPVFYSGRRSVKNSQKYPR